MSTLEMERVRRHTTVSANQRIDDTIASAVYDYAERSHYEIDARLEELGREWDIERLLETNASAVSLIGLGLGATVDRRWLWLPAGVLGFLLLHGTQGWCPPLPVLRYLGIRTRDEIARERFALKYLRGDFAGVRRGDGTVDIHRLLTALER